MIVLKPKYQKELLKLINEEISTLKLEIAQGKTQVFLFIKLLKRYYCFEKNMKSNQFQNNTIFSYLGFSFDGKYTFLKSASLAKYYRKMKRAIKRSKFYADSTSDKKARGEIFKSKLYKSYTSLGSKRRRIYQRDNSDKTKWVLSKKHDWGNFLTYAYMAARIMKDNKIKGQLKNHWTKFHELLAIIETEEPKVK